jgi:hypothetical protein
MWVKIKWGYTIRSRYDPQQKGGMERGSDMLAEYRSGRAATRKKGVLLLWSGVCGADTFVRHRL